MITQLTVTEDRNFDDIAHKFAKNIYDSDKGGIRQVIVWEELEQLLSAVNGSRKSLHVLDAGGGLAQISQKLAKLGHRITLCDLSSEMLQLARQDIEKNGLLKQYRLVHSSAQNIAEHLSEPVDVLMFHAVMEWLVDPKAVLQTLLDEIKPGGAASIMFYNHYGLVYKNVVCGNIPHILAGMPHRKRFKLQPQKGLKPEEVYQWIEESGFKICGKAGIRCFNDYIGNREYIGDYQTEHVVALEKELCRQEPYLSLGRYVHVWAIKNRNNNG